MRLIYMTFPMVLQVHAQGVRLGRSVDMSNFSHYDELKVELEKMFQFDSELMSSKREVDCVYW